MINNRQGGRRRGRGGGQRPPNSAPQGNRQDNRSRGNAAQLHEKYKALARDTQLAGDRVQTEYYLQFADHYYRILNENRARFEEQRRQRGDDDEDEGEDEMSAADGQDDGDNERDRDREPRGGRTSERGGDRAAERGSERRFNRGGEARDSDDERRVANGGNRPRRERRPEAEVAEASGEKEERISLDVLPPSIGAQEEEAPKPVRRRAPRRPRDDAEEIAPAA